MEITKKKKEERYSRVKTRKNAIVEVKQGRTL